MPPAVVRPVGPEATVALEPPVFPLVDAMRSMTEASATACRPEYSSTVAPIEWAVDVGRTVTVGRAPPPAVTGAVQMLISVPSEAWKPRSFTYVFPAESVTLATVEL